MKDYRTMIIIMSGRKTGLYFENYEKEWVLDGATVLYGSASELRATLEYDFLQEKTLFTKGFRWRKSFIILQSLFQDYGKSISLVRKIQERRQYFNQVFENARIFCHK